MLISAVLCSSGTTIAYIASLLNSTEALSESIVMFCSESFGRFLSNLFTISHRFRRSMTLINNRAVTKYLSLLTAELVERAGQTERSNYCSLRQVPRIDRKRPFNHERFVSGERATLRFSYVSTSDAFYSTSKFFVPCPFHDWTVTHICRYWRWAAITSDLWSNINTPRPELMSYFESIGSLSFGGVRPSSPDTAKSPSVV